MNPWLLFKKKHNKQSCCFDTLSSQSESNESNFVPEDKSITFKKMEKKSTQIKSRPQKANKVFFLLSLQNRRQISERGEWVLLCLVKGKKLGFNNLLLWMSHFEALIMKSIYCGIVRIREFFLWGSYFNDYTILLIMYFSLHLISSDKDFCFVLFCHFYIFTLNPSMLVYLPSREYCKGPNINDHFQQYKINK